MSAAILLKTVDALSQFGAAFQLHAKTDGKEHLKSATLQKARTIVKLMFRDVFIITC